MGGGGDVYERRDRPLTPRALPLALLLLGPPANVPPLGVIAFYGLRTTPPETARRTLGLHPGDVLPSREAELRVQVEGARRRLEALPGVTAAHLEFVCCDQDRLILYVGITEGLAGPPSLRPELTDSSRLPEDILAAGAQFDQALEAAMLRGDAGEDQSLGHALMNDPASRAVQQRFIVFAARDPALLRRVLHGCPDEAQRALAAQVLAYSADKVAASVDLVEATQDTASEVRNNALRALGVMASAPGIWPEGHLPIPAEPLVELLRSPVWTDRNKASLLLEKLTEGRQPSLLGLLSRRAFDELVEMARWPVMGHAYSSLAMLGRIAGLSEEQIVRAIAATDREALIAGATKARGTPPRPMTREWWARKDSNLRLAGYEPAVLTAELRARR